MEVKCKVCGTVNDKNNPFCKGCFLPLHKTMEEFTQDIEDRVNMILSNEELEEEMRREDMENSNDINEDIPWLEEDKYKPMEGYNDIDENISLDKTTSISLDDIYNRAQEDMEDVPIPVKNDTKDSVENLFDNDNTITFKKFKEEPFKETIIPADNSDYKIKNPVSNNEEDLKSVSILYNEKDKEKSFIQLSILFDVALIVLTLIFSLIFKFKSDDKSMLLYGILSTMLFSGIGIVFVFKKDMPKKEETDKTLITIFISIVLFEIIFRSILLYNSGIYSLYVYFFIAMAYILISMLIVNTINRFIRTNRGEDVSKNITKINIIGLVIAIILVGTGLIVKKTNVQIKKVKQDLEISYDVPDELYTYLTMVNEKLAADYEANPNASTPLNITDPNFVENEFEIEELALNIDEVPEVYSGQIKYKGVVYNYTYNTGFTTRK